MKLFNRPVTPLTADVVEKELAVEAEKKAEPASVAKMLVIGERTLNEEQKAIFDRWDALSYPDLQKIGAEHEIQVAQAKKVNIIFGLMDKGVAVPE